MSKRSCIATQLLLQREAPQVRFAISAGELPLYYIQQEVPHLELVKINHIVQEYAISSRTLRYYEEAGLLWSHRPAHSKQRHYDPDAIQRLKQILLLRKLQIPIKDIAAIYQKEDSSNLIQAFINKLDAIDEEIGSLTELRLAVDEFLQQMLARGITKISGLLLLQEETARRIQPLETNSSFTQSTDTLNHIIKAGRQTLDDTQVRIIRLPAMHVISSVTADNTPTAFDDAYNGFLQHNLHAIPGLRERFYIRLPEDHWKIINKVPANYQNNTPFTKEIFSGGLFAVCVSFIEDMDTGFQMLREWVLQHELFELDLDEHGKLSHCEMLEELLPDDITKLTHKYQQDLFLPVRIKKKER